VHCPPLAAGTDAKIDAARYLPEGVVMFQFGLPEVLVILAIMILMFGGSRLPDLGRGNGRAIRNFRDATREGAANKNESA
jgi:sec-independent protein translocase protein TatA